MTDLAARLDEFRREHPKKDTVLGTTEWTYRVGGSGSEGLVALPGALGGSEGIATLLSPLEKNYRSVFIEYPLVRSLEEMLSGISAIVKREGIGRTALVGGSFGGLVAQAYLLRYAESTNRVILSGTGPPDSRRARTNGRLLPLLRFIPMGVVRSLLRFGIKKLVKRIPRDREFWLRFYTRAVDELTRERLQSLYRVSIDFDRSYPDRLAALESWPGEMLLIEGSEDRVASQKSRDALRTAYPRAEVLTLEGAGHALALERPEQWQEAVTRFLMRR